LPLSSDALFDVEQFRTLPGRSAVAHVVGHPTVVLGSAQRAGILKRQHVVEMGAEVVQRRGGGGAVLLRPGDHLWIDAWVPRDDPLWDPDVSVAAAWVGAWWRAALEALNVRDCEVHHGRAVPGRFGALVCFSGRGPGEVFRRDRKVMGVSQWRSREGSLLRTCAYLHWEPGPLIELLDTDPVTKMALVQDLETSAVGLADVGLAVPDMSVLRAALLSSFPTWGRDQPTHSA
jgi:lipoate-protein ligase A